MRIVLSHPTGNANVREAAKGLKNAGILSAFFTSIAIFPGSILYKAGTKGPLAELRRRTFDPILKSLTKSFPFRETGRIMASKTGIKTLIAHEKGFFCIDAVYRTLDRIVSGKLAGMKRKQKINAVYAYEDGAEYSFRQAKQLGIACLYDLPIGYWRSARNLMESEQQNHPEWASTLTGFFDSEQKLARKDEELRLADHIFVASSFTAQTLNDYPDTLAPVSVIPYGFPPVAKNRTYTPLRGRKLRLLFVGGLSQRKGIANLFEAIEGLENDIELTIVGNKAVPDCEALNRALKQHRWIPSLPHQEVLQLMRENDVFAFPSLFEGFGLVITEAMSQGTPVITTERTCGPDLIEHGENGWLVSAGSSQALHLLLKQIIEQPDCVEKVGRAAMESARKRPWEVYGKELAEVIVGTSAI